VTFDNKTSASQTVTLISLTIDHKPVTGFPATGTQLTFDPNSKTPELFIVYSSASSQRSATITYSVNGQVVVQEVSFATFNPCKCNPKNADPGLVTSDCS
jgi:hypothetical protein